MRQGLWFHSPSGWGTLKVFDFSIWHAPWLVCLAGHADGRIVSARVYEKCCVSSILLTLTSFMISPSCLKTCESGFVQVRVQCEPYWIFVLSIVLFNLRDVCIDCIFNESWLTMGIMHLSFLFCFVLHLHLII